ncbi:RNA polymerase-associated protein RapA [Enhygromyxa salina]|uniref:RNA polymerase-associated protein RapA n=1 Tax=Enhygromyxa salina TaxID=215803 RepID=A0A2S9XAL5_9BACT|nr:helicase-related protein [Enhygromyxa salina]PRP89893.1 RNA polymerase-associated protein RapA [Enhygromyxa salina]
MSVQDSSLRQLVAPGELRADLFRILGQPTPTDILVAAPGLSIPYPGCRRTIEHPGRRLPWDASHAFRAALLAQFAQSIDRLPQTAEWEDLLRAWTSSLAAGEIRIRQVQRSPLYSRLISRAEHSIVPQAPLALSTQGSELELSVELRGSEHLRARAWFARHFEEAAPLDEEVLKCLEESWAGGYCTPRDIYYFTLMRYFHSFAEGMNLEDDDNPMLDHLTDFQKSAYDYAKMILSRYGGVFLADVVGLGKTYIGLALLNHLKRRYGERAVVIAPPSVCPAWDQLGHDLDINLKTISIGKLEELDDYTDREVVVIDESHNFRNSGTLRYETLQRWLRPDESASQRKVLLLSATPQNNRPEDIKNQIALFPDNYTKLPFEDRDAWFRDVAMGRASLRDLLQHIVVRRTRRDISRSYPDAKLRVRVGPGEYEERPLAFPTRLSGEEQCLRYSLDSTYGKQFYTELLEAIRTMRYPLQGVGHYLREDADGDARVSDLRRGASSVRGLFKVLLLKRLESSIEALHNTLARLDTKLAEGLEQVERGRVPLPPRARASEEADTDTASSLPITLFEGKRLLEDILADKQTVGRLVHQVKILKVRRDEKFERLIDYLDQRQPTQHKTIIFTQFADTAHYLHDKLGELFGRTEVVTGASSGIIKIARRFAPVANRIRKRNVDTEIDLLISTDTLSEGVNLQDADTLINYDLHWNPTRLIQRAGRIDRLGSEHDEIHVCGFVPQRELEADLKLVEVLQRRIREFIEVFGEDNNILPGHERPDIDQVEAAYTGAALDAADASDELDGLSRHSDELARLRKAEPAYFAQIMEMRSGRRAVSQASPSIVATRCGWYWEFWTPVGAEELDRVGTSEAFEVLRRHAEAGEASKLEPAVDERQLVERARAQFEPLVELFRQRRLEPQLSKLEFYVLDRLGQYRKKCPEPKRPLLDRLEAWVKGGSAQLVIRKQARLWKKHKLAPAVVFEEARLLMARFPAQDEDLGDPEIVGTVFGPPVA